MYLKCMSMNDVTHLVGRGICQKVTLLHKPILVKWVTRGEGRVKNLKKLFTSFMDNPLYTCSNIICGKILFLYRTIFPILEHCLSKKALCTFFCIFMFLFINKIMAKNNFSSNHKYTKTQEGICCVLGLMYYSQNSAPLKPRIFMFRFFQFFVFRQKDYADKKSQKDWNIQFCISFDPQCINQKG